MGVRVQGRDPPPNDGEERDSIGIEICMHNNFELFLQRVHVSGQAVIHSKSAWPCGVVRNPAGTHEVVHWTCTPSIQRYRQWL